MFILFLFVAIFIVLVNFYILARVSDRLYSDIDLLPNESYALVLGTSKYVKGGSENSFFNFRIQAAYSLYSNKKVSTLIVSGDETNSEASRMRDDLIELGIPQEDILMDPEGYSTFRSVARLKEVFGVNDNVIIISQNFHNQRALFLADYLEVDAIAFNAKNPPFYGAIFAARDFFAKLKIFYDLYEQGILF